MSRLIWVNWGYQLPLLVICLSFFFFSFCRCIHLSHLNLVIIGFIDNSKKSDSFFNMIFSSPLPHYQSYFFY